MRDIRHQGGTCNSFYDLSSGVMYFHFYHILLVAQSQLWFKVGGQYTRVNPRRCGSLRNSLEANYHINKEDRPHPAIFLQILLSRTVCIFTEINSGPFLASMEPKSGWVQAFWLHPNGNWSTVMGRVSLKYKSCLEYQEHQGGFLSSEILISLLGE